MEGGERVRTVGQERSEHRGDEGGREGKGREGDTNLPARDLR